VRIVSQQASTNSTESGREREPNKHIQRERERERETHTHTHTHKHIGRLLLACITSSKHELHRERERERKTHTQKHTGTHTHTRTEGGGGTARDLNKHIGRLLLARITSSKHELHRERERERERERKKDTHTHTHWHIHTHTRTARDLNKHIGSLLLVSITASKHEFLAFELIQQHVKSVLHRRRPLPSAMHVCVSVRMHI